MNISLKNRIENIERDISIFKEKYLPLFRKQTFEDKTMSIDCFNSHLNLLKNLSNKKVILEKKLEHVEKLNSIEKSISYMKDFLVLSNQVCVLSYSSSKEEIKVMFIKYNNNNLFDSIIVSEDVYTNKEDIEKVLLMPFVKFVCHDKRNLFELLNKQNIKYDKNNFVCIQRMSLFYYNDLSKLYNIDKIYEDIALFKENTDDSIRKIKHIFEGLIMTC